MIASGVEVISEQISSGVAVLKPEYGSQHIDKEGNSIVDQSLLDEWEANKQAQTINSLSKSVQVDLRKRKYDFARSEEALLRLDKRKPKTKPESEKEANASENGSELSQTKDVAENCIGPADTEFPRSVREKKRSIDWKDKLYLSPLTTVGNLPFRRICKEFGVDITCGEMAMASNILQGANQEWALIKRHGTEDIFGVQVCGNNPYVLTRCAQVLQEQADIDFVDINMGCPIDLVYQQGGGCGLMRREKVLYSVVECMNDVLDIPLTIKMRTGIYSDKSTAHKLISGLCARGVSLITVHGRSREQRYTRSADWSYIETCAKLAGETPLFGNGDILSYEDYVEARKNCPSISGVMIGRGALIKPWIFTEIKEQRMWDISSNERFEIIKKYVNYGLHHWGSDTKGVENTRRFLLEWLSFLYRYIPVGLLETPPQKVNQRPPFYRGRNDLETLMASPNCDDWVKISEMLLGPVPDGFTFLPKHKANSWK
ncbi:hypothetical protein LSTR_LSTR008570 [Laodelphax striatellus]|uniref:tRNA-dihydrouridine(47) synthase [NAD(P)(+)] n=1 Tax=Laodelphax striatellus TaxID=195883 RepID=A0A482WW63_LAOST|nr:hypothetical protein LSTR_LSTR008570 [Laodelphax striatellus]